MDWTQVAEQASRLFEDLHNIHVAFYDLWVNNVFLTWRWFLGVALILVPWIIWFIIKKKSSTHRLLYAGFSVMLMSAFFDVIGIALGLWCYPYNVFPLMPEFIPFDISVLPVTTMVSIQFFPKVRPIYKALICSALGSFVFQPLMQWAGLYDKMHWKDYYSFPILVGIYMAANYFATRTRFDKL
jgi:hypothetical protein